MLRARCTSRRAGRLLWKPVAGLAACAALLLAAHGAFPQSLGRYGAKPEKLPKEVASQPVAFSHKRHASVGLECLDCHKGARTKARAGVPETETCMLCHTVKVESPEIAKLRRFHESGEEIPWVRVYGVPDFVFFHHGNHVSAGVECARCHGPVAERDVLAQEVSTRMGACMSCHKDRGVSNECYFCHELGR